MNQTEDLRPPDDSLQANTAEALAPDFELLRPIGGGRAAHVFLAREPALKRLVAVKVLRAEVGGNETVRARFEREARSAAGISHPQIPAVHRVGRLKSGLPYMVQEYIEGRTLRARLEAMGAAEPEEARRILGDVAAALSASHERGVIHRDVRPGNVMLEREGGRAFLMDFGLAAVRETGAEPEARLTQTGEIIGDPHYASPEQLRGEPVTAEADIYSLGVLGYEILTLTNPFGSDSRHELFAAHLRGEPNDLPWQVTTRDPELGEFLLRCLQKDPARRPRAAELALALAEEGDGSAKVTVTHPILSQFPRLAAFWAEIKRRQVYQVGAAYFFGVAVLLGFTQPFFEGLPSLDWLYTVLVLIALAGLPVVLVLSWIFDITSSGIQRTEPSAGGTGRAFKIAGVAVSTALVVALAWFLLIRS